MTTTALLEEAIEIVRNAKAARERGEITAEQAAAIIAAVMQDVGWQLEIVPQPRPTGADR